MKLDTLTDSELALLMNQKKAIPLELCIRVIDSNDSDLGRDYAIQSIEYSDRFEKRMKKLTENRIKLLRC